LIAYWLVEYAASQLQYIKHASAVSDQVETG
jgi:hypothetical protein